MDTRETLEALFQEALKDDLKGTGIELRVKRYADEDAFYLCLDFQYHGRLCMTPKRLQSGEHPTWTLQEARALAREMKRALMSAGSGELKS